MQTQVDELFAGHFQLGGDVGKILIHHPDGELVVACRHRGMGSEDVGLTHDISRLLEGLFLPHQFADTLDDQESRVTFVHVPYAGVVTQLVQGAHATQPEQNFL